MNIHAKDSPRGVTLLVALLCCLAVQAQPGLEYWFDGNYGDKVNIAAPSAAGTYKNNVNVTKLSQGFHTIYIRARGLSQDAHSPVTSAAFFKYDATDNTVLEYWFDEGEARRLTVPISIETGDVQALSLDLSDIDRFPLGVHRLNIRVSAHGGNYSPVYTTYVLRMPEGSGDAVLEYWFDDDLATRANKPICIASNEPQAFDLDLSAFPIGFHKLSIRIAASSSHSSQIYTAHILRLPIATESNRLTYWLDDDYANRRSVPITSVSAFGSQIIANLQLPPASMGMHRLHWRASRGGVDGPVEEAPVLITKMYNSQASVHMANQSIWLDDNEPSVAGLNSLERTIVKNYYLSPNDYAEGQHEFHVMYQNSAGVWSAENVTYFYKDASNRLRVGRLNTGDDASGIADATTAESLVCYYRDGQVVVDCQSARLGSTGYVTVSDLTGKQIAQAEVDCSEGLYAELNVGSVGRQLLIVKVVSGRLVFTRKLMAR
ncbi:MAG: hypothetical protein IJ176_06410 [Prevotella sp.]|nr:hypothetical protein [Prevotella sp.]